MAAFLWPWSLLWNDGRRLRSRSRWHPRTPRSPRSGCLSSLPAGRVSGRRDRPPRSSTSRSGPESLALCKHGPVSGGGRRVALGLAGLLAGLTAGACGRAPAGPHSRVDTATASNICTVIIGNEPPPGGRSIAGPEFCAPAIAQASHASRAVVWRLYYVTRSDSSLQSGIWRRWIPEATVAGLRRHP